MSKVVDWGHWLITLFLGFLGMWFLLESIRQVPHLAENLRQTRPASGDTQVGFVVDVSFVAWIPALLCAWGLYTWRRWGQVLTIVFCGLTMLLYAQGLAIFGRSFFSVRWVGTLLAAALIVLWLVLPPVRQRFHV
jgi:putative Mn2+ efflux pump MntP